MRVYVLVMVHHSFTLSYCFDHFMFGHAYSNIASARSRSPDVTKKVKQENYVCVVTVIKLHMYDLLLSLEIIPSW